MKSCIIQAAPAGPASARFDGSVIEHVDGRIVDP
jgi:hypothetical protein